MQDKCTLIFTCTFIYEIHKQRIDNKSIVERTELKLRVWLFSVNEEIFSSFVCKKIVKMLCMTRLSINVFWVLILGYRYNFLSFFYFPILQHGKGAWLLSNSIDSLLVFFFFINNFFPHAVYIYTGRFQQRGNQMPAEFMVHLRSIKWPEIFTSQPESMLFDFVIN